jgi:membrane-associated HD superfamily phosphohydrolase
VPEEFVERRVSQSSNEYSNGAVAVGDNGAVSGVAQADEASQRALSEAREILSHQIIGEQPLVPPSPPLRSRIAMFFARHHGLLLLLCTLLLWGAMTLRLPGANGDMRPGGIATHDILAPRATTLLDRESTRARRDEAAALVTPEYDSDLNAQNKALNSLADLLRIMRREGARFQAESAITAAPSTPAPQREPQTSDAAESSTRLSRETALTEAARRLNTALRLSGFPLLNNADAARVLTLQTRRWNAIGAAAREAVRAAYFSRGRVQQIRSDVEDDLALASGRMARVLRERQLRMATNTLSANALSTTENAVALILAREAARVPNLVVNTRKTERARAEARSSVPVVYRNILPGSVLVEAGATLNVEKWAQLQDLI